MDGIGFPMVKKHAGTSCLPYVYPYTPLALTKRFQEPEDVSKVTGHHYPKLHPKHIYDQLCCR